MVTMATWLGHRSPCNGWRLPQQPGGLYQLWCSGSSISPRLWCPRGAQPRRPAHLELVGQVRLGLAGVDLNVVGSLLQLIVPLRLCHLDLIQVLGRELLLLCLGFLQGGLRKGGGQSQLWGSLGPQICPLAPQHQDPALTRMPASLLASASPIRASFWTWAVRALPKECR